MKRQERNTRVTETALVHTAAKRGKRKRRAYARRFPCGDIYEEKECGKQTNKNETFMSTDDANYTTRKSKNQYFFSVFIKKVLNLLEHFSKNKPFVRFCAVSRRVPNPCRPSVSVFLTRFDPSVLPSERQKLNVRLILPHVYAIIHCIM